MEHSLLHEMNKRTLSAYLSNQVPVKYFWQDFFPAKPTPYLKYETLIGSRGNPVMADIVAENTPAPIKRRPITKELTGNLPPIKISRPMKESDLNDYNVFKTYADDSLKNAILDLIFDDVDFCFNGCNSRLEWLTLRAMSQTYIALTTTNNAGIITTSNIDYQMLTARKNTVSVVWGAAVGTTKPITDFLAAKAEATTLGIKLKYAIMDATDWGYFQASTQVQNYCLGYMVGGTKVTLAPTKAVANAMLAGQELPQIIVVEQSLLAEDRDNTQTAVTPWVTGHVLFVPQINLGDMFFGPIADETNPPKQAVQTKNSGVLIQKFSDVNPITEWTLGITNAFPSWPSVDDCWNMYTLHTSTWA